ncbi:MAG: Ig-like domain-containing protein [Gemmatimonadetes bacterium]|nr:Ig-like domain-containing protein [Gemmatimonadota bacterium]
MNLLIAFLLLVGLAGCGQPTESGVPGPVVRLEIAAPFDLIPTDGAMPLQVVGYNAAGYQAPVPVGSVIWRSSDEGVASVTAEGAVTGHRVGSVTITASTGGISASRPFRVQSVALDFQVQSPAVHGIRLPLSVSPIKDFDRRHITWSTSNPQVVTVNTGSREPFVETVDQGVATITASLFGLSVSRTIEVLRRPLTSASELAIVEFELLEIQYPGSEGFAYAPQIRVRETAGGEVDILGFSVTLPGNSTSPPVCGSVRLNGHETRDLVRDAYGSYEIEFGTNDGRRVAGEARLVVNWRRADGSHASTTAEATIKPGLPPAGYNGGGGAWWTCR